MAETSLIVTKVEVDELLKRLPAEEAQRTLSFIDALKVFARSTDKARCAAEMAVRLEPLGCRGLSLKSLYRKLEQFKAIGVWACIDKRVARRVLAKGIAANRVFVDEWQARVMRNRRKVKPAWRALIMDLVGGVEIPGVGTWRELYAAIYGYRPSADEICPWTERNPPPGWSFRNLAGLKPDKFALAAARIGMGKAKIDFLPTVKLTRVGLKPCQVVEVDDMWYEHMVIFGNNKKPQRVVEFAAMDRLTGHVICHLAKPVVEAEDGTRKTLKSAWVRYLYHYILCVTGVPAGGCVIKGEHGTAASDDTFAAALGAINATRESKGVKPIVFRAGSIITEPLAKGAAGVQHHGNPRHKGMIEQMHATLKNYTDAIVLGGVGGGRGVQPEETAGMVREDMAMIRAAGALDASQAGRLRFNFPTWPAFAAAAWEAHRRMDVRTDHALEGWEECGFMVGEIRMTAGAKNWSAMPAMRYLTPAEAGKIQALIQSGAAEYRVRRMSPAEAWQHATKGGVLEKVPVGFAPMILGRELAHAGTVSDKLTIAVRDHETGERYTVSAVIDGRPLTRGEKVSVWVNPMDAGKAYVADAKGRFMGVATVLQGVRADADATVPELQMQLGLRSAALAEERKRLEPHVRRVLADRNAAAARNISALGLEDPVERQAIQEVAAAVLEDRSESGLNEGDFIPDDSAAGDDLDFDDFN